ncbi:MAG TPA: hypothetical protein VGL53_22530, partial [Bryobacteraceae bacterium]
MMIFGGFAGGIDDVAFNDVWVLTNANGLTGTPQWIQLAPTGGPLSRAEHTAIYDSVTNRMTIFGGCSGSPGNCGAALSNSVWTLINANGLGGTPQWVQLSPTGTLPAPRTLHSAAYDSASKRMMVFGGGLGYLNDTWVLTSADGTGGTPQWIQLSPSGALPPGRNSHTAVYHADTNRMTIFSGASPTELNDLWVLNNANGTNGTPSWTQILASGSPPLPREASAAIYDPATNRMVAFGGLDAPNQLNDVWVLLNADGIVPSSLGLVQSLPNVGGNAGQVTVLVIGSGFQNGAGIKLTGTGIEIFGANTTVISTSVLTTTFDLTGATPGTRTVVVANPDQSSISLSSGFTIEQGGSPQISVDIIGRSALRLGAPQTFYLAVKNSGNLNASSVAASVGIAAPTSVQASDADPLLDAYSSTTVGQVQSFIIPTLAAGTTQSIPITLTAPSNAAAFGIRAQHQSLPTMGLAGNITALSNASGVSDLLGGLLFGPPLFDGCAQPLQACTACDNLWNDYKGQLDLATNAQAASHEADLAFFFEGGKVAAEILEGASATTVFALYSEDLAAEAIAEGLLTKTQAATFEAVVSGFLQFLHDCFKGVLINDPNTLNAATANAAIGAEQTAIAYQNIRSTIGIIKSQALQQKIDRYLLAFSVVQGAVQTITNDGNQLKSLWDERNESRGAFLAANSSLCKAANDYIQCSETSCGGGKTLPTNTGTDDADLDGVTVSSLDPNDKVGSPGNGVSRYVALAGGLSYSVYFENLPTATAPAQSVTIIDVINPGLDLRTLTLGPISLPNQVITPPSIPLSVGPFTTTADLRPSANLLVTITASLNTSTGVLTWTLQSLDPTTNQPPNDPTAGLLPPGAEGSIFFTVMPGSSLPTGSVITNTGTVAFDANPPINTPTWSNTIDNTKPVSHVNSLPASQTTTSFPLSWTGSDVGAGVQDFTIYASDNGGSFSAWLQNVSATSAI